MIERRLSRWGVAHAAGGSYVIWNCEYNLTLQRCRACSPFLFVAMALTVGGYSRQAIDLNKISKSIISHAENTLTSLYNLQKLSIRLHGRDLAQSETQKYREQLKAQWESTAQLLQNAQGFSGDVVLLRDSIGTASIQDVCESITEMISTAQDTHNFALSIIATQSPGFQTPYDALFGGDEYLRVKEERYEENQRHLAAMSNAEEALALDFSRLGKLDLQLELIEQAMVPLRDLQGAIKATSEALQALARFWSSEAAFLSRILQEATEGRSSMSQQEALEYAALWRTYDEQSESDVNTIFKLADAIVIAAQRPTTEHPVKEKPRQEARSTSSLPQISEGGFTGATKVLASFAVVGLSQLFSRMGGSSPQAAPQTVAAPTNAAVEPRAMERGYSTIPTRTLSASPPVQHLPPHQTQPFCAVQTNDPIRYMPSRTVVNLPPQPSVFPYERRVPRVRRVYTHIEL